MNKKISFLLVSLVVLLSGCGLPFSVDKNELNHYVESNSKIMTASKEIDKNLAQELNQMLESNKMEYSNAINKVKTSKNRQLELYKSVESEEVSTEFEVIKDIYMKAMKIYIEGYDEYLFALKDEKDKSVLKLAIDNNKKVKDNLFVKFSDELSNQVKKYKGKKIDSIFGNEKSN